MIKKFYTCRYDRAFKEVFMKEENKDILSKLLESILKVKIEKIEFLNLERNVDNINIKRKHLDLYLETNIGKIQVEVNSSNHKYIRPRNFSYLCDIYSHNVLVGESYKEDKLIIQINFNYGVSSESNIEKYMLKSDTNKTYIENFIIYEINMEKYKEIWYNRDEKKIEENKYIIMLDLLPEELKNLSKRNRMVLKYMSELERVNESPKFREFMSAEEDNRKIENSLREEYREEGLAEGREQGIKEGIKESSISIAKKMLQKNMDLNLISEVTELPIEELEKLNI